MSYHSWLTWPITGAVWAGLIGLAWLRSRRHRARTVPKPAATLVPRPGVTRPAVQAEPVSDEPAYGSIYQIGTSADEGGENE